MAYIGNWPTSPGFQGVNFKQESNTLMTKTVSGRSIRSSVGTLVWSGTLRYPIMNQTEFRPIQALIALAQGPLNEFDIIIPTISTPQGLNASIMTTCTVNGNHTAGDTTIDVATDINTNNILKAGDIIRFANHTKVYMCTTDVNTDAGGQATINIQPALIENLTSGEVVTYNNVPFRMHLTNDLQEFAYRTDNLVQYELDLIEAIG